MDSRLDSQTSQRLRAGLASWCLTQKGGRLRVVVGGGLGDCLVHTPFLRQFRASGRYTWISCVCPRRAVQIFDTNPHLDEVIPCGENELPRWAIPDPVSDVFSPYVQVESVTIGPDGLHVIAHLGWLRDDSRADQPIVRQIAEAHGLALPDESMEIFSTPEDSEMAAAALGPPGGMAIVIIDTRHADPFKDLSAERWQAVAARLQSHASVVEQAEQPVLRAVRRLSPLPPIRVSAEIYRRADCVVGADSFPIHLATAVGTPCVALFGPGDPRKFGHSANYNLRTDSCPPCFQPAERGCLQPRCLDAITPDQIADAVMSILAQRRGPREART
jgi:ADP-heptose:LPS heptosyltransferase